MNKIVIILMVALGIAGAAIGIYASSNPTGMISFFTSSGGKQVMNWIPVASIIFFVVVFGLAFAPVIFGAIKNSQKKSRLKVVGIKKRAKILSITGTGLYINNMPQVKLVVETQPGVQAEFTTMTTPWGGLVAGGEIDILVDPSNPTEAVLAD